MSTDYRALCAELIDLLDCFGSTFNIPIETSVVTRARAALAQPEVTNPITPPPELVDKWEEEWHHSHFKHGDVDLSPYIATRAAQWGADQELEACCHEVQDMYNGGSRLRAARRPKPPSLKEQALEALERMQDLYPHMGNTKTIRRVLEALPND
jgi:hypothetical protein